MQRCSVHRKANKNYSPAENVEKLPRKSIPLKTIDFFFFFDSGRTFYLTLFFIAEAEAWCCVLLHEKFSCQQPIPYSKRKSHVIVWWSQEKGRARSKLKSHMYFILPYLFALLSLEISVDAFQLFILYILWHSAEYSKCGLGRVWACPTRQVRTIW